MKKRGPVPIADILSELHARRGIGRVRATEVFDQAWREAAGELIAAHTRVGHVRRGRLEVIVANSTLVQELTFQKSDIIKRLNQQVPDARIADLRFRVGAVN